MRLFLLPTVVTLVWTVAHPTTRATESSSPHFYSRVVVLGIGIDSYWSPKIPALTRAEADVRELLECLQREFGYEPKTLLGKAATKQSILDRIHELDEKLGERDALIVYFAGHGHAFPFVDRKTPQTPILKRMGYLIPYDAELDLKMTANAADWEDEALNMQELVEVLNQLQIHHVLLIADCCCSGFLTKRGAADSGEVYQLLTGTSRTILAATTQSEKASDGKFTPLAIEILTGFSGDEEVVSVTDVFQRLRPAVSSATGGNMTPQMSHVGDGDGEFLFFPRSLAPATIKLVESRVDEIKRERQQGQQPTGDATSSLGALRGVMSRAQKRKGRRTQLTDVLAAANAPRYWYGAHADEMRAYWQGMRDRFRANAAWGDSLAMAALHFCYAKGVGEDEPKSDPEQAYRWALAATSQQKPAGLTQFLMGRCYRHGIGMPANPVTALKLYEESAEKGFALGKLGLANMLLDGEPSQRDITRAFELLEEAAQDGLSEAHETLGLQYLLGSYTKTDVTKSVRHLEQAEKLGSVLAASLLYEVYSKAAPGFPPQQLSKAEAYLRKAAGQGYALAQFALALELGHIPEADLLLNLRRDVNEARSWLSLAVKQELGAALYTLAKLQAAHNDVGIPIDAAASKKNLERAIEFGFAPALFQRALWHYREGSIYPQDNVQALRWAVRAGSIGDPGACVFAGELYEKGIGIGNVQPVRLWSGHWMRDEIHPYTHYGLHWYFKALRNGDNKYARERLNLFADKLAAERRLEEEGSKYDHYIPVFERWKSDFADTAKEFDASFARNRSVSAETLKNVRLQYSLGVE